jgi:hypothetical protein
MRFTGLRGSAQAVDYDVLDGQFRGNDALVVKRLNAALNEEKYGGLSALELVRAEFGEQVQEEVQSTEQVDCDLLTITYEQ